MENLQNTNYKQDKSTTTITIYTNFFQVIFRPIRKWIRAVRIV